MYTWIIHKSSVLLRITCIIWERLCWHILQVLVSFVEADELDQQREAIHFITGRAELSSDGESLSHPHLTQLRRLLNRSESVVALVSSEKQVHPHSAAYSFNRNHENLITALIYHTFWHCSLFVKWYVRNVCMLWGLMLVSWSIALRLTSWCAPSSLHVELLWHRLLSLWKTITNLEVVGKSSSTLPLPLADKTARPGNTNNDI